MSHTPPHTREISGGSDHTIPRPSRPFSPSPPRENRHSASRPPSMLFGAPSAGIAAAPTTSIDLAGLPSTPTPQLSIFDALKTSGTGALDQGFFSYAEERRERRESARSSKMSIGRQTGEAGIASGEFTTASNAVYLEDPVEVDRKTRSRRSVLSSSSLKNTFKSIKTKLINSDSISTTSSASPPLGATSILAAIADPPRPSRSRDISPIPSPSPGIEDPCLPPTTPSESTFTGRISSYPYDSNDSPRSIQHSRIGDRNSMSLSSSKSMPRLHQPTVVRSTSGRGIAFLPPPAQVSPSTSDNFAIHQPRRKTLGSRLSSDRFSTIGVREGDKIRPRTQSTQSSNSVSPSESQFDFTSRGDQIVKEGVIRVGGHFDDEQSYGGGPSAEAIREAPNAEDELNEVDDHEGKGSLSTVESSGAGSIESSEPHVEEEEEAEVPEVLYNPSPREVKSDSSTSSPDSQVAMASPKEEDDLILHEVPTEKIDNSIQNPIIPPPEDFPASPKETNEDSQLTLYIPPYTPRANSRIHQIPLSSEPDLSNEKFAITLYAGISRPAKDVVPYMMNRLEVHLAWGTPTSWKWVPGRWLVPEDWKVMVVDKQEEQGGRGLVRYVARGVVARLPVVWRLAGWL